MFCSKCGTQNEDGNKFCSKCGNPLQVNTVKFCSKCGTQNEDGNKFCSKCGNPMQVNTVNASSVYSTAPGILKKFDIKNPAAIVSLAALFITLITPFFPFVSVDVMFYYESASLFNWAGSHLFAIPIFFLVLCTLVFVFLPLKIPYAISAGVLVLVETAELLYLRYNLHDSGSSGLDLTRFIHFKIGYYMLIVSIILVILSAVANFLIVKKDGKYGII